MVKTYYISLRQILTLCFYFAFPGFFYCKTVDKNRRFAVLIMLSVPTNNCLVNRSFLLHGDKTSVAHQCICQTPRKSTFFQERTNGQQSSSHETVSQMKEAVISFPRRLVVYNNAIDVQKYSPHPMESDDWKCLTHHSYSTTISGGQSLDKLEQTSTKGKTGCFDQKIRREAPKAHLDERCKITENPAYHIIYVPCLKKIVDSPSVQGGPQTSDCFKPEEKVKAEIYKTCQNGFFPVRQTEFISENEVILLKPSGYHTQRGLPVPMGNHDHSTHGIQPSQVEKRTPQTLHDDGELKRHFAGSTWPRTSPLVNKNFVEPMTNYIRAPAVVHVDSIENCLREIANSPQQKSESIQQKRYHPTSAIAESKSRPKFFSSSHPPYGNSFSIQRQIQGPDVPVVQHHILTATAFQGVQELNPKANPHTCPPGKPFESARRTKCASPDRIFEDLPVRCPAASTGGGLHQKANSTVIPTPCVAFPSASYARYRDKKEMSSVYTFYAESNTIQKEQQNAHSIDLSFKGDGCSQPTDLAPQTSACGCSAQSQTNESEKVTICSALRLPHPNSGRGYSPPLGSEKRCDVTHLDFHEPKLLYHPKPAPLLLDFARGQAHTQLPSVRHLNHVNVQALQTSNLHDEPKNTRLPSESCGINQSQYSAFHSGFHQQQPNKSRQDLASLGNHSQALLNHQMCKQTSADNTCESRNPPCSSDVMRRTPSFFRVDRPSPSAMKHIPDKFNDSLKMEVPSSYISADSKPQDPPELEEEQRNISPEEQERCQLKNKVEQSTELTKQSHNNTCPEDTVTRFITFVVGLETEILSPKKKRNPPSPSVNLMQTVSWPQATVKPPSGKLLDPSATDCEDSVDMIRLERVYYSAHPQSPSSRENNRPTLSSAPHLLFNESELPVNGQLNRSEWRLREVSTVEGKAGKKTKRSHTNPTFLTPNPRKRKGLVGDEKRDERCGTKLRRPVRETVKMILEKKRYARRWSGD